MAGSMFTDDTVLTSDGATPRPAPNVPRLLPGSTVGSYTVVAHLGAGAMGTVFRARDVRLGREVALKFRAAAHEGQTSCRLMCSLLGREAQTLASVSHPNLLSIYDVGEFRGCIFLALELIDGSTLREWAPARPFDERLAAVIDVGHGLAAAHCAGVVHRDIKPDNVLVSSTGQVKLADFGLARTRAEVLRWGVACGGCAVEDASGELAEAVDESFAGTPLYMAPEQLAGAPASELSDQFSYAVTAWETLFDARPFDVRTLGELKAAIAAGPPDIASAPLHVIAALRRALSPDPASRHGSVEALVTALDAPG